MNPKTSEFVVQSTLRLLNLVLEEHDGSPILPSSNVWRPSELNNQYRYS
jgi:hypothetical protein